MCSGLPTWLCRRVLRCRLCWGWLTQKAIDSRLSGVFYIHLKRKGKDNGNRRHNQANHDL